MANYNTTTPVFIDATVFLAHLTDGESPEALVARDIFSRLETGKVKLTTSPLVILQVVTTLRLDHPKALVVPPLSLMLAMMRFPERKLCQTALDLWLKYPIEFSDALNVANMQAHHVTSIYSSDKHLDSIPGVDRHERLLRKDQA
jgi:predicted nucleic acid-binding protein